MGPKLWETSVKAGVVWAHLECLQIFKGVAEVPKPPFPNHGIFRKKRVSVNIPFPSFLFAIVSVWNKSL